MPDQPLAMPQQCPPALSMTPPMTPNESSQPPPLPPLAPPTPQPAPSDVHEFCVPLTIHKALEKDYQALESRLKSVLAENRALRQQAGYFQNVCEAQKDGATECGPIKLCRWLPSFCCLERVTCQGYVTTYPIECSHGFGKVIQGQRQNVTLDIISNNQQITDMKRTQPVINGTSVIVVILTTFIPYISARRN